MIRTKLAHYEITSHLGSGGMGDVYQATDSKLGRCVAIKLLPEAFSHDSERVARFEREARVLASLNHPNIAAIHGLEESGGRKFLVMELVGGETLAERITRGPIPIDESLNIAKQICEALESAHERGIIHRDLKPANVKITPDGKVKVLDFGLAKAFEPEALKSNVSQSPTLSMAATNAGVILGTAAYMSPEQAKGRTVDKRTDIFAFGCVLYEMLTGRAVFEGEDVEDILGSILKIEPDWTRLPSDVPRSIQKLLRLCLEKNAKNRRSDVTDVRLDIEQAVAEPATIPAAMPARRARLAWIMFAAALFVAAFATLVALRPIPSPPEMRTEISTPATTSSFALSPDGRQLVFVASGDGQPRLWLRALAATSSKPLAGTEGANYPFWSPDSRSVGFFASGTLKRADIDGGPPQPLASAPDARGGTWNSDGVILFSPNGAGPLFRVAAAKGGEAVAVTKLDRQISHRFPSFLSDGRHFLFFVTGPPETGGLYLGSLDSAETKRLTAAAAAGMVLPSGWLLFIRTGTLVAQQLDQTRGALTGDPVTIADKVGVDTNYAAAVSVSAAGLVAYRAGESSARQLTWFDRAGKVLGTMGTPDENGLVAPELSPDGRRVAVHRTIRGNTDIWLIDANRATPFTFDASNENFPLWSLDGTRIVFRSDRKGVFDLYQKRSDGTGDETLLLESPQSKAPYSWSPDGRLLLHSSVDPKTGWDLWVLPVDRDGKPGKSSPFLHTDYAELNGQFSPDGRWVAYQWNRSGEFEIWVRSFPTGGGEWLISTAGGIQPRWRHDGKELYYVAPNGKLMVVPITVKGAALDHGSPVPLFQTHIWGATNATNRNQYDVARDGRFLINIDTGDTATSPITLLQNWKSPSK